jgi:hypothetical protein
LAVKGIEYAYYTEFTIFPGGWQNPFFNHNEVHRWRQIPNANRVGLKFPCLAPPNMASLIHEGANFLDIPVGWQRYLFPRVGEWILNCGKL